MKIEDLFRSDGKLNSAITRQAWFKTSEIYSEILKKTEFAENATLAERIYLVQQGLTQRPFCNECNQERVWFRVKFPYSYDSSCINCQRKSTGRKRVETKKKLYGKGASPRTVEAARQRAGELNRKGRETLKLRWGVDNPGQLPHVKKKMIEHHQDPTHLALRATKRKETSLAWYQSLDLQVEVIELTSLRTREFFSQCLDVRFKCHSCGKSDSAPTETFKWRARNFHTACYRCSNIASGSGEQRAFYEQILVFAPDAIYNDRKVIYPLEIDIYVPSKKLGIEYHGIFWHTQHLADQLDREQHRRKIACCEQHDISLLQFSSLDDRTKTLSIIKHKLGLSEKVHGRACRVIEVSTKQGNELLDRWHLKGGSHCSVALGLEMNGEVIAVMTFGTSRFEKNRRWELIRFACKLGTAVTGGANKLLSAFEARYHPSSLVTYADRFISSGNLYRQLGFVDLGVTPPGYFYWHSNLGTLSRHQAQKHKLLKLLGEKFIPEQTEVQNMLNNGWRIFYDAGNRRF